MLFGSSFHLGAGLVSAVDRLKKGTDFLDRKAELAGSWAERDHALFVGWAPTHAPLYATAVVVPHGGSGSRAAAPIARDILLQAQRRGSASDKLEVI